MKQSQALEIREIWKQVEDEFPDKSTAFLLEVTVKRCRIRMLMLGCDCADIADALIQTEDVK